MHWGDTNEIAIALVEAHPDIKPLELRFTELHKLICELAEFDDDPDKSTEGILEAILMAWLAECD